jgi:predicted MPP superfamily phosphohydrolase
MNNLTKAVGNNSRGNNSRGNNSRRNNSRGNNNNNNSKKKTKLKDIINKYILQKGDICCESDFDREEIKSYIYDLYKKTYDEEYLDYINNDLVVFIGYLNNLKDKNDKMGVKLWNNLDKFMTENENISQKKLSKLLDELPLYYVLAFIGRISLIEYTLNKL